MRELAALDGDSVTARLVIVHDSHGKRSASLAVELTDVLREHAIDVADDSIDRHATHLAEIQQARAVLDEWEAAVRADLERKRAR